VFSVETSPWHWHSLPLVARGRRRTPAWAEGFRSPLVSSLSLSRYLPVPTSPLPHPAVPFSISPLLPDICFFSNVTVRCRLTANEIRSLFLRPGSYSRSPCWQLVYCRPSQSFSLRVNEFRNFSSVNIEEAERRPSVPRSYEDPRLRTRVSSSENGWIATCQRRSQERRRVSA